MANIRGKAYAINVLTPIKRWKTPALKAVFLLFNLKFTLWELHALAFSYFARWTVISSKKSSDLPDDAFLAAYRDFLFKTQNKLGMHGHPVLKRSRGFKFHQQPHRADPRIYRAISYHRRGEFPVTCREAERRARGVADRRGVIDDVVYNGHPSREDHLAYGYLAMSITIPSLTALRLLAAGRIDPR